jgi:putative ABC transport system permease protein
VLRFALKGVLARKLRLALTATSVILGVAFVSGTFVLTDTLNATFDRIFGNAEKGVSVVVRGVQAFAPSEQGGAGDERALVPGSVLVRVQSLPGVASAIGVASGYAQLVYHGRAVGNGAAPTLGTAWTGNVPANPLHIVRGRPPALDGEVVIDQRSADKYHIVPGAAAVAVVQGTTLPVTVVGVVRFGSDSTLAGAALTTFSPHQAQMLLLGRADVWSTVQATAAPGVSQQTLADRVAASLDDPTLQVLTQKRYVADQSQRFKNQLKFFNILLLVFAFISVFVAVFIIFNTFTVLVAQRTRELALVRALGGSRPQVLLAVVIEAGVVGLFSGLVGLLGGVGVAAGLRALIQAIGGGLVTVALRVEPRTVLVSLIVGLVVTATAALVPAVRAARIPPVAAMREDFVLPTAGLRRRTRIGQVLLAAGVLLLVLGVNSGGALEIGLGALAMFRGVVSLSPVLSRPIIGGVGRLLPRLWGLPGRLARENALRNPRRTSATASALMIGIALTTTMSIMAASITTSANSLIDTSVGADFIITAKNFGPVPDAVTAKVAAVPGAGAVTAFRTGSMKVAGSTSQIQGVTPGTVTQTLRLKLVAGSVAAALDAGQLVVNEKVAKSKHWQVGSKVTATFALTGAKPLVVGGIYADNPIAGSYLLGMSTYEKNFRNRLDVVIAVKAASTQALGTVRAGLAKALKATPTLNLRDQSEFKADQKRQINQVLSFVLALLVLSLVIAWLGIVNTLALSVFERTREIGLLRAVGMATKQVRRMVRLEAVVISLFGALLGVALGLGYGAALVQALRSQGVNDTSIPVLQLIGYLVIGVLAGITAAWWPARRAAKLNVLGAIATE